MLFYFWQLILFLFYSLILYFFKSKKSIKIYCLIIFIHLSLVMGFRNYSVGTDTPAYMNYFINQNTAFNSGGSLIYNLLSKLVFKITDGNYTVFLLLLSALSIFFFLKTLYKSQKSFFNFFLSVYIYITYYFYFDSFNMQRQMLAVSLSMYSIYLFIEKKYTKSTILFLLAVGIHSTALISLLSFLLVKVGKRKNGLIVVMISTTLLLSGISILLQLFSKLFNHYYMYVDSMNTQLLSASGGTLYLGLFFLLLALTAFWMNDLKKDDFYMFTLFATVVGSIFYIMGKNSQLIIRVANYFLIFAPVFIPNALEIISTKFLEKMPVKLFTTIVVMLVGVVIMYYKLSNNLSGVVPYSFAF